MDLGNIASLRFFFPELLLTVGTLALILIDLALGDKSRLGDIALIFAAGALLLLGLEPHSNGAWLFHRMIVLDSFAVFFRALIALAAVVAVWMSIGSAEVRTCQEGEYYAVLLASTLGMFLMATSANLLMAYLSLEFVSLTSYILTGILKHNRRSQEAALKYLIYGGVASGMMIYGMSWIYGLAGSLDFNVINRALFASPHIPVLAIFIALLLILAGFGYKVASVPFHMWAPDVYEGAPIPVTTFLAIGSKAAGFALLTRFFYPAISQLAPGGNWAVLKGVEWPELLLVICGITMTLGNLAALQQDNMKRMLAYSSIAQAGYALMGFVLLSNDGIRAMLVYLFAYYLMDAGAFLVVMMVANATGREDIGAYRGLSSRGGLMPSIALTVFLLSLTGIPATIGFIGKFYVFAAAIQQRFYVLAIVGILNSVVSLYYYMRPVKEMFLEEPDAGASQVQFQVWNYGLMGVLAIATILLGLYPPPVI
ncbi:MAG: NADH-quinone oxidoreductase subunit N, partial [Candidatus Binataceae bacterium]